MKTSRAASGHDSTDRARGPGVFVRRHGLVSYHALAYVMSWLVWMPYVLSRNGLGILHGSLASFGQSSNS